MVENLEESRCIYFDVFESLVLLISKLNFEILENYSFCQVVIVAKRYVVCRSI